MVANKDTSDRPAPQQTGTEEDLLPAWTPATNQARATYTVANEWTISQAGWIDQYGVDVLQGNLGAQHAATLQVGGTTKDTDTFTPDVSGLQWMNITPLLVAAGAVLRVQVQVTLVGNNYMPWYEQAGLFASAPVYCSLAQGQKDAGAKGTTGYGCHLILVPGTKSPDWDVVAYGGAGAGAPAPGLQAIPLSTNHWVSAASTNPTLVKASAGTVYTYMVFNNGTSWCYLKLYNKATAPVPGTDVPQLTVGVPPGGGANLTVDQGASFSTGIGFALTGAPADADTTAVAANQAVVNLLWL